MRNHAGSERELSMAAADILIVDDDPGIRELLADILETRCPRRLGLLVNVQVAENWGGVTRVFEENPDFNPRVALVDLNFELVGGSAVAGIDEVLPRLRPLRDLLPGFEAMQIVIYSGQVGDAETDRYRDEARKGGAYDFWPKDRITEGERLVALVGELLGMGDA